MVIIDTEKERLRYENACLRNAVKALTSENEILHKAFRMVISTKNVKNNCDEAIISDIDGR